MGCAGSMDASTKAEAAVRNSMYVAEQSVTAGNEEVCELFLQLGGAAVALGFSLEDRQDGAVHVAMIDAGVTTPLRIGDVVVKIDGANVRNAQAAMSKLGGATTAKLRVKRMQMKLQRRGKLGSSELKKLALERGFSEEFADSLGAKKFMAYFAKTELLQEYARSNPAVLKLPWERLRAMGVVELRRVTKTEYTFLSHQWQHPSHPWPDLLQVTDHIADVETPYVWADWYCVPQWARTDGWKGGDDEAATAEGNNPAAVEALYEALKPDAEELFGNASLRIEEVGSFAWDAFKLTMVSFHKLCFCSSTAILVFKRADKGLTTRGWDAEMGRDFGRQLMEAVEPMGAGPMRESLVGLVGEIESIGLDLEYAIRAWCVLERCYLPETEHSDVRVMRLVPALEKLRQSAIGVVSKAADGKAGDAAGAAASGDAAAAMQVLGLVEELRSVLALCQPSQESQKYYQNAWSFHYLKKKVLTITNAADYQYLDPLLATDTHLGDFGALYLQAVADAPPGDTWLDPRLYLPEGCALPSGSLLDLVAGCTTSAAERNAMHQANENKDKGAERRRILAQLGFDSTTKVTGKQMLHTADFIERSKRRLKAGQVVSKVGGAVVFSIHEYDASARRLTLTLSDAGLCGAAPHVSDLEITWAGAIDDVDSLTVRTTSSPATREWTPDDRRRHGVLLKGYKDECKAKAKESSTTITWLSAPLGAKGVDPMLPLMDVIKAEPEEPGDTSVWTAKMKGIKTRVLSAPHGLTHLHDNCGIVLLGASVADMFASEATWHATMQDLERVRFDTFPGYDVRTQVFFPRVQVVDKVVAEDSLGLVPGDGYVTVTKKPPWPTSGSNSSHLRAGDRIYSVMWDKGTAKPAISPDSKGGMMGPDDVVKRMYRLLRTAPFENDVALVSVCRPPNPAFMLTLYDAHKIERSDTLPPWMEQVANRPNPGMIERSKHGVRKVQFDNLSEEQTSALQKLPMMMIHGNGPSHTSIFTFVVGELTDEANYKMIFNSAVAAVLEANLRETGLA